MIRIVFLGTPEAAIPTLAALATRYDVGLVLTQPDRPRGRSGTPMPPAVKEHALTHGLQVAQPESKSDIASSISRHGPFDLGVIVAYGQVLTSDVLELPGAGLLNVHFSLLPRWRGAAPVARALMEGDPMTGITIIKLDQGLDTGPVLTAQAVDIGPDEDAGTLTARLARIGAGLLTASIPGYLGGTMVPQTQSEEGLTYAAKITAEDRPLDLSGPAVRFINRVRALSPVPGATLRIEDETHRVLEARLHDHTPQAGRWESVEGVPVVACAGSGVELVTIHPPGKNPMSGEAWVRGRRVTSGEIS